jgi:two-component system KDP operon response regulator KdpE
MSALGSEKRSILVVDDDRQITRVLKTALAAKGYTIRTASDGDEALAVMKEWLPDLLLTDLKMPNLDGLALCQRVRSKSNVPIIVLSVKGDEKSKVEALDAGADDYVTKPFNSNELFARVRAALRRASTSQDQHAEHIELGDFSIDLPTRSVKVKGKEFHLTPKEFDLLVYMARHPGRVLTHRTLLNAVWGGTSTEQPEYLRVFVGQLRKKIEPEEGSPRYIQTEPWVGYRFVPGNE